MWHDSSHCWKSKLTKQSLFVLFIPRIAGQLTLEPGETLHINTSEPSAAVADNWGNRRNLLLLAESSHSFINQIGDSREWKYGVARLVFAKDIILNSNSSVNISGENALSVESLEGNIVVKTMIDLSCTATELGGKCVGGYMPIDKPKVWYSAIIPGKPVQSFRFIYSNKSTISILSVDFLGLNCPQSLPAQCVTQHRALLYFSFVVSSQVGVKKWNGTRMESRFI